MIRITKKKSYSISFALCVADISVGVGSPGRRLAQLCISTLSRMTYSFSLPWNSSIRFINFHRKRTSYRDSTCDIHLTGDFNSKFINFLNYV